MGDAMSQQTRILAKGLLTRSARNTRIRSRQSREHMIRSSQWIILRQNNQWGEPTLGFLVLCVELLNAVTDLVDGVNLFQPRKLSRVESAHALLSMRVP